MLPRCFVVCILLLASSLAGIAQSLPHLFHVGRNILITADKDFHSADCILCSADVEGRTTGSVRVFAGNVFLNGAVGGNVLVFGGKVTLTSNSKVDGRVVVFGGHLHQDPAAVSRTRSVFPPIIFLPIILLICIIIGGLIVLARRMVRGPVAFPPLPRL
jgi:hypothetical protein